VKAHRSHVSYWTFLVHRLSGVALCLFLPVHFTVLGTALQGEEAFESVLLWAEQPWVIGGEWVLVVLLSAHLAGGLRLLALEFLPWLDWQKTLAAFAAGFALAAGLAFALSR